MSKTTKRERQKENRERARVERERMMKRDRRMKSARSVAFLLVPVVIIALIISAVSGDSASKKTSGVCGPGPAAKRPKTTYATAPPMTIDVNSTYSAAICTSEGDLTLQLDAKAAPVATNNFVFLAEHGFYDGQTFHRAAKNFVIQGGDPKGDGSGGPGYSVAGEVPKDHYPLGALAAAKSGSEAPGTFGSQFFVVTGAGGANLPNDYARFGSVTTGLKAAQKIEKFAPASGDGTPTKNVKIVKVVVKVNGKIQRATTTPSTGAPSTTTSSKP